MKKKIAILGANEPLASSFIQTRKMGYEIHCFALDEGAVCKQYADYFYPISFSNRDYVLKECERIGIDGIVSFSLESALPTVNYVAQRMNLEGNPIICEELTANKYTMRQKLKKDEISVPEYFCVETEDELLKNEFTFPQIVKPIDSGGSRGVTLVKDKNELKEAYKRALAYSKAGKVLIEQFIEGREFSVEYISYHGKHYFITITDKVTTGSPYFVELEHHQPAAISIDIADKIKETTEKMLDSLQVYSSASHTEIKIDKDGKLFVIEMGARMGGDMIASDLVRLSTGYDFVKGVLELATGNFKVPQFNFSKHSGIYYIAKETIKAYDVIKQADNYPPIVFKKLYTENIKSIKESADRAGFFIYQADEKFDLNRLSCKL